MVINNEFRLARIADGALNPNLDPFTNPNGLAQTLLTQLAVVGGPEMAAEARRLTQGGLADGFDRVGGVGGAQGVSPAELLEGLQTLQEVADRMRQNQGGNPAAGAANPNAPGGDQAQQIAQLLELLIQFLIAQLQNGGGAPAGGAPAGGGGAPGGGGGPRLGGGGAPRLGGGGAPGLGGAPGMGPRAAGGPVAGPQNGGTAGAAQGTPGLNNLPQGQGSVGEFLQAALNQNGDRYVFGAEASKNNPNPTTFDCSELVEWAAAQAGVNIPDGSSNQRRATQSISVDEAMRTPGALLFRPGHVAISLGDGRTIEARGRNHGVGIFNAAGRFTSGGLIPGMRYG